MEFAQDVQNVLAIVLFLLRILTPALSLAVLAGCFLSLKRGRRREEPVVLLEDVGSGISIPVLYWENSIGRSRSCDIVLPDHTVSRDHAVLMRRESGWMITDTNSKAGTLLNGKKIKGDTRVLPGDVLSIGSSALMLKRVSDGTPLPPKKPPKKGKLQIKRAPSPGCRHSFPYSAVWHRANSRGNRSLPLGCFCCCRGGFTCFPPKRYTASALRWKRWGCFWAVWAPCCSPGST